MSYEIIKADDGIEIRDDDGSVVAGPSTTNPIRGDDLTDLLDHSDFTDSQKDIIRIVIGDMPVIDE